MPGNGFEITNFCSAYYRATQMLETGRWLQLSAISSDCIWAATA